MHKEPINKEWEYVQCLLCGITDAISILDIPFSNAPGGISSIVRCKQCGLRRLNPRPRVDLLTCYYDDSYYAFTGRTRAPFKQKAWNFLRDVSSQAPRRQVAWRWTRPFFRRLADSLFDINVPLEGKSGLKVVEIGCGFGDLLIYLKSRECEVQGVDQEPLAAQKAAEYGVPVHVGPLEDVTPSDGYFDIGVLSHALEHLPDPLEQLTKLARAIKIGGTLHIAVPNGESAGFRIMGKNWTCLCHPQHLWYFDASTLSALLKLAGFDILEISHGTKWLPYYWDLKKTSLINESLSLMKKTLGCIGNTIIHPEQGDNIRAVAIRTAF